MCRWPLAHAMVGGPVAAVERLEGTAAASEVTCTHSFPLLVAAKVAFVDQLLQAKAASGKSFDEIAAEIGSTNAYAAQLFFNQAQLKPSTAAKLKVAVPQLRWAAGRRRFGGKLAWEQPY